MTRRLIILAVLGTGIPLAVLWRRRTLAKGVTAQTRSPDTTVSEELYAIEGDGSQTPGGMFDSGVRQMLPAASCEPPLTSAEPLPSSLESVSSTVTLGFMADAPSLEQPCSAYSAEQPQQPFGELSVSTTAESKLELSSFNKRLSKQDEQPSQQADVEGVEQIPLRDDDYEDQSLVKQDQGTVPLRPLVITVLHAKGPTAAESEIREGCAQSTPRVDSDSDNGEALSQTKMRITKRPGGGRGEYEISESFGSLTPRDLINHIIILSLGSRVEITTGVRLLRKHGKLRLRMDEEAGCEIHLHRQLAAALMLPYPAREESGWASDYPIMQSGLYGIRNIAFSSVALAANSIARMEAGSISVANRVGEEYVQAPERLTEVMRLWDMHADLPQQIASLLDENKRLLLSERPLGLQAEKIVSDLQEVAAVYCQAEGLAGFSASHDVLPLLIGLLQPACLKGDNLRTAPDMHSPQHLSNASAVPVICGLDENEGVRGTDVSAEEIACHESQVSISEKLEVDTESRQNEAHLKTPELNALDMMSAAREEPKVEGQESKPVEDDFLVRSPPSPRKYRPQPRSPITTTRSTSRSKPLGEQRNVSAPVDLRLRSRIGGTYTLTFLPRRRVGMPPELEVVHSNQRIQLSALHEDWYQDVLLPETGRHLRDGLAWYTEGSNSNFRWSLPGREIFTLGTRNDLSGFISVPCLILGAQHIVICGEEVLQQVLNILHECCEHIPQTFGESDGLPAGWVGIGPLVPTVPLPLSEAGEILDILRPDPTVAIELKGGVRIQHNQFLVNYPPQVHVYGSIPEFVRVLIDGQLAEKSDNGFTNTGWDTLGEHVVSCGAVSRSYTVVEPDDGWDSWPAYSFHLTTQQGSEVSASICGTHVTGAPIGQPILLVPISTPVLLGSQPGEIYVAPIRRDLRTAVCPAFPPFTPIWAVPQNPLRADKATARVVLLQPQAQTLQPSHIECVQPSRAVLQWCMTILDCCRKGLNIDPAEDNARILWKSYKDLARRLRRASR